jgi:hypothetical protein
VPAVLLLTSYWRHDLIGLYTGMAIGYFILTILYFLIILRSDWTTYAEMTQQRAEATKNKECAIERLRGDVEQNRDYTSYLEYK